jgi:hypothetical protein
MAALEELDTRMGAIVEVAVSRLVFAVASFVGRREDAAPSNLELDGGLGRGDMRRAER